jgi:hypothetical protein
MVENILDIVSNMNELYYRLLLLVDMDNDHEALAKKLSRMMETRTINLNYELSKELMRQTTRQRKLYLSKSLSKIVPNDNTVILDHIEILFDIELQYDPIRLLESISRNRTVIAFWSGQIKEGRLIYAEQGHPEYRSYDTKDMMIIEIDKEKGEI